MAETLDMLMMDLRCKPPSVEDAEAGDEAASTLGTWGGHMGRNFSGQSQPMLRMPDSTRLGMIVLRRNG
jgi:hypothetical protein